MQYWLSHFIHDILLCCSLRLDRLWKFYYRCCLLLMPSCECFRNHLVFSAILGCVDHVTTQLKITCAHKLQWRHFCYPIKSKTHHTALTRYKCCCLCEKVDYRCATHGNSSTSNQTIQECLLFFLRLRRHDKEKEPKIVFLKSIAEWRMSQCYSIIILAWMNSRVSSIWQISQYE